MKKYILLIFSILFTVEKSLAFNDIDFTSKSNVIVNGIGFGSVVAAITSWERNKSVLWVIIHGMLSWIYVVYFLFTRKQDERK
ncbi:hypothetical protein [Mesonia mobilis]|uniref:hypothetical protein n=1 Tax=Mesonia mobilis TaxID=369791 RepID=UPI0024B8E3B8|nr:hypothetical protein [Mesonia mobilis]|tara:strand:- start:503 stop:751 length:249 start_codon:yes stop_codon:yes gene_type:complete